MIIFIKIMRTMRTMRTKTRLDERIVDGNLESGNFQYP